MLRHFRKLRQPRLSAEDNWAQEPATSLPLYISNCPDTGGQTRGLEWTASKPQAVPGVPTVAILWKINVGLHNQTPKDQMWPVVEAGSDGNTHVHNCDSSYDSSSQQPGSSSIANNDSHVSSSWGKNKGRRKRGDPPDDRDGKKSPPKSPATRTSDPGYNRQFACPYQVCHLSFDSPRCPIFRRISDVRQHINRKHRQPHYCPRCGLTFADGEERAMHLNQENCQVLHFPQHSGTTREQWEAICERGRVKTRRSDDERWFEIWDILFPGRERPRSTRPHSHVQDLIMKYRDSGRLQSYADTITAGELEGETRVQMQNYIKNILTGMTDDMCEFAGHGPRSPGPQSSNAAHQGLYGDTPLKEYGEDEENLDVY